MKKTFLYNFLILINIPICIFYTSCKKESLTRINPNDVTDASFWKSEKDAVIGLNGVFDAFQVTNFAGQRYREFDLLTDNASMVNAQNGWGDIKASTHNSTTLAVENFWRAFYTVVARANYVIDKVEKMPSSAISDAAKKRIIAEASFLRAYVYHDLTSLWGDVPFYTKPHGAFDEGKGKTSKDDIYKFIMNDLEQNIIPNLPLTVPANENGRIRKGAAQFLLGKYHLYKKDYAKAAGSFQSVMTSNVYRLYPEFVKLFTLEGEYSAENLFEIGFVSGGIDNGESFSIQIDTSIAPRIAQAYWTPNQDLVNSYHAIDGKPISGTDRSPLYNSTRPYENRDPRLRASVLTNADITPGGKKIWNFANNRPFAVKKFFMLTPIQYVGGPQNYYMIRYADVLLLYAEAQNEAVGPDASVYAAVNQVRARVAMPPLPAGLTKDAMRTRIQQERRWEFAFEHQRYFDLKRWGTLKDAVLGLGLAAAKFTDPRDWLWPYPQTEMDNNPALKKEGQNPGW
ncbi:MAG TPA: RagB/SusD family nutrient uptake outer membrane protein [Flavisolibacter sp.]|nr:RagB/SusD family nutrient uptake outer membrane protein [Flavisolibacter sp.]